MKKLVSLLLVVGISIALTGAAYAITLPSGPITLHWTNWETQNPTTGELSGIFRVDQILQGATPIWNNLQGGEELTGEFGGLMPTTIPGADPTYFTGGWMKVYLDNTPDFSPTNPGSGVTDAPVWLDLVFVPGALSGLPAGTTMKAFGFATGSDPDTHTTLTASARALLNVIGGDAEGVFNTSTFPRFDGSGQFADISMSANTYFRNVGDYKDGWPIWSSDPMGANVVIPEPTSMLLIGMGMLGLFGLRKKA